MVQIIAPTYVSPQTPLFLSLSTASHVLFAALFLYFVLSLSLPPPPPPRTHTLSLFPILPLISLVSLFLSPSLSHSFSHFVLSLSWSVFRSLPRPSPNCAIVCISPVENQLSIAVCILPRSSFPNSISCRAHTLQHRCNLHYQPYAKANYTP